jgi:hypothetical protein
MLTRRFCHTENLKSKATIFVALLLFTFPANSICFDLQRDTNNTFWKRTSIVTGFKIVNTQAPFVLIPYFKARFEVLPIIGIQFRLNEIFSIEYNKNLYLSFEIEQDWPRSDLGYLKENTNLFLSYKWIFKKNEKYLKLGIGPSIIREENLFHSSGHLYNRSLGFSIYCAYPAKWIEIRLCNESKLFPWTYVLDEELYSLQLIYNFKLK